MRLVTHWKHGRALPSGRLFHASVEDVHNLLRFNRLEAPMSELGLVSRVSPVQTALRNCTRDEGRSFEVGNQDVDLKPPQAAVVKSNGGERCGNVGTRFRQARLREASV